MNKDKSTKFKSKIVKESESDSDSDTISAEAYIDALEMYLEAFKLSPQNTMGYPLGMKAVYFSKAVFAYLDVENKELVKSSKKLAITALNNTITEFEPISTEVHTVIAAKLAIEALKTV